MITILPNNTTYNLFIGKEEVTSSTLVLATKLKIIEINGLVIANPFFYGQILSNETFGHRTEHVLEHDIIL